ncbi:hypothetical protein [Actinophytocola sp.]|uniref:hypothetical protein n=1 Tax=Actinophytocola sp. TaxID=1872138 RepID=UPI003D6A6FCD
MIAVDLLDDLVLAAQDRAHVGPHQAPGPAPGPPRGRHHDPVRRTPAEPSSVTRSSDTSSRCTCPGPHRRAHRRPPERRRGRHVDDLAGRVEQRRTRHRLRAAGRPDDATSSTRQWPASAAAIAAGQSRAGGPVSATPSEPTSGTPARADHSAHRVRAFAAYPTRPGSACANRKIRELPAERAAIGTPASRHPTSPTAKFQGAAPRATRPRSPGRSPGADDREPHSSARLRQRRPTPSSSAIVIPIVSSLSIS